MSNEPLSLDAEQPVDAARLEAFANEIRTLPTRRDSEAERCESACRLLKAAIDAGAFGTPEYAPFLVMVQQRLDQQNDRINGWISAWSEVRWRLTGRPEASPRLDATFAEDCERVAKLILDPAAESPANASPNAQPAPDDGQCWVSAAEIKRERGIVKGTLSRWAKNNPEIRRLATPADRKRLKKPTLLYVYNERLIRDKLGSDTDDE